MKVYGQILKFAIVFYLVILLTSSNPVFKFPIILNNKLSIGIILFLGFIGFYIIDSILEYREITQREHEEEIERKSRTKIDAIQKNHTSLKKEIEIRRQVLHKDFKKKILGFVLWFMMALGSVITIVIFDSDVIRFLALFSFVISAIFTRLYWVAAVDNSSRDYNLKNSLTYRQDIDYCIYKNEPIALYLQDFGSSSETKWTPSRPYFGSKTSRKNPSEGWLVSKLSDLLPVFAFHNHLYPDISPSHRIISDEDAWFDDFLYYSSYAKLLIVDAHKISPGIESEISSIGDRGFGSKTILLATDEELDLLGKCFPGFMNQVRWKVKLKERDYFDDIGLEFPDKLLYELKQFLNIDSEENPQSHS